MDASSSIAADSARSPKLKVFISYSRDDLKFADQLDIGLKLCGFEPMLDRHGISGGEDWKQRLGSLIRDADTVVFVLSPSSARSEICKWEVDEASRLNKRILPVLVEDLGGVSPPSLLQERNYIFFYDEPNVPGSGFGAGLAQLVGALQTDLGWIREHTRLLARATEWDLGGRPKNRLLSGSDIADAKDWAARRPKDAPPPTNLHLDLIKASEEQETARSSAERQQLEMMARAQEERAKALAAAEDALSREALAQSRRIKLRNASLIAITLFALVAGWGWLRAVAERRVAQEKTTQAETQKRRAERQTAIARQEKAQAEKQTNLAADMIDVSTSLIVQLSRKKKLDDEDYPKVLTLFQKGAEQGNPTSMGNLGAMYEGGLGIEKSFAKATGWYRKAAKLGNPRAMIYLGDIYLAGRHTPRDRDRAAKWYLNAGLAGNSDVKTTVGNIFLNGKGVAKNLKIARSLLGQAAEEGNVAAMNDLGTTYDDDAGEAPDYATARQWYEKAAASGSAMATSNLAVVYCNGKGTQKDIAKCRELSEKAAAMGNEVSKLRLKRLAYLAAEDKGDYAEAVKLREAFVADIEALETARTGAPGKDTADSMLGLSWDALLARNNVKALAIAERAHKLDPSNVAIETNHAHALMFLHREVEARVIYRQNKGKKVYANSDKSWETVVAEDFAEFRKRGIAHPMMAEIEKEMSASR